jgi:hypothetical protein
VERSARVVAAADALLRDVSLALEDEPLELRRLVVRPQTEARAARLPGSGEGGFVD